MAYKYCRESTISMPFLMGLSDCIVALNTLLINEGYCGDNLFDSETVAINFDLLEKYMAVMNNRARLRSMDSAICVVNDELKQIVLIEYKLNHNDFRYLTKLSLENKVNGTKSIVSDSIKIYKQYYFVVKDSVINQAYNRFFRMNPSLGREYLPITVQGLKELYF